MHCPVMNRNILCGRVYTALLDNHKMVEKEGKTVGSGVRTKIMYCNANSTVNHSVFFALMVLIHCRSLPLIMMFVYFEVRWFNWHTF
jgi:hypothetical protein